MIISQNKGGGDIALKDIFANIANLKVTVIGDLCLDAYWEIDTLSQEKSIETGLLVNRIRQQRYSLGAACNIVSNLSALGVGSINVVGLVGEDLWGYELMSQLGQIANTEFVLKPENFQTMVYCKPLYGNHESNRFDLGGYNIINTQVVSDLIPVIYKAIITSDIIIVNQQVMLMGQLMLLNALNKFVHEFPEKIFLADSRHFLGGLSDCYMKLNQDEASKMVGLQDNVSMAKALFKKFKHKVYLTCGADGIIVADEFGQYQTSIISVKPPVDVVGAGDTVIATIGTMLGAGLSPQNAAEIANLAGSMIVKKLLTTGVITQSELLQNIDKISIE